jgi:magnesium transporter
MLQTIQGSKMSWIDVQDPTKEDVAYLKEKFNFHPLVLDEIIPPGHRPKVERYPDYLVMIFYYPVYNREKRKTRSRELDIIVTKDTLITSHYRSILPLKALFDNCNLYEELREKYMSDGPGHLLFYLLDDFWKSCLNKLVQIDKRINEIEKEMFRGKEKEMVREISLVKTDIINFWRIIEHQEEILESLIKEGSVFFGGNITPYFSDLIGTYRKSLNNLKTYKEAISALENTNQSLLSSKINEVMRTLTLLSALFLPLGVVASIWYYMPLARGLQSLAILIGTMLSSSFMLFLFFRKKRWL